MLERVKRQKAIIYIIALIILVLAIMFIDASGTFYPQQPVTVPYEVSEDAFRLIDVQSPSGRRSTFDNFERINFEFSDMVDINTLKISVDPYVDLKILYSDKAPTEIGIRPAKRGWLPSIRYEITISSLDSLSGESLSEQIDYIYQNDPPDTTDLELPY